MKIITYRDRVEIHLVYDNASILKRSHTTAQNPMYPIVGWEMKVFPY
jgi:hypothetical protein